MTFIRHGRWCRCERSCNSAKGTLEAGVSAYECVPADADLWTPTGPAWVKNGRHVEGSSTPWFLIEGDRVPSRGGDGEPLVEKVKFKACLRWNRQKSAFEKVGGDAPEASDHAGYPSCQCKNAAQIFLEAQEDAEDEEDESDGGDEDADHDDADDRTESDHGELEEHGADDANGGQEDEATTEKGAPPRRGK